MAKFGGAQPGAGRKKGIPNKATLRREGEIAASGLTPLAYMLQKLRAEDSTPEDRKWAAQNAAPYVHPRLSTVTADIKATIDIFKLMADME